MSNYTYTWQFPVLEVYKQNEGQSDVVYNVHWRYKIESGSYSTDSYGVVKLSPYSSGSSFVPYDELTEEIVTGWVVDSMGTDRVQELQSAMVNRIETMINPPTAMLPPPWTTPWSSGSVSGSI